MLTDKQSSDTVSRGTPYRQGDYGIVIQSKWQMDAQAVSKLYQNW